MATITLYASKINQMPGLLKTSKQKIVSFKGELQKLNKKILKVDGSACDVYNEAGIVQASVKTQEGLFDSISKLQDDVDEFISDTVNIDNNVASLINANKKDFYKTYSYLKPECEKSKWDKIKDGFKKACEWCKDHWKEIMIAIEAIVAVGCLFVPGLQGFGILMLKGLIIGLVSGAVMGGISGYAQYGVKGIKIGILDGAKEGALIGAAFGGLGGLGSVFGEIGGCSAVMERLFSVSSKLSLRMLGFDMLALANDFQARFKKDTGIDLGLINPTIGGFISYLNHEAHSNPYYNAFQLAMAGLSSFSYGYVDKAVCFIAGTLIATIDGFKAIEEIKAGDIVLSADEETLQVGYKPVLETYIRKVHRLVHLLINGEEIITTVDHPFYVKGQGFINAVELCIGSELIDNSGNILNVEQIFLEDLHDETVDVYNFQVEDYHTYFVGEKYILVHNAGDLYARGKFRKSTHEKMKADAPRDADGDMICPTCGKKIPETITQNGRTRIGYDGDHYPTTWNERAQAMKAQPTTLTRKQILDIYNQDVRVQCPECNQGHKFEGIKGDYAK